MTLIWDLRPLLGNFAAAFLAIRNPRSFCIQHENGSSVVGYFQRGPNRPIRTMNATRQIIPSHHGLNGIGNKITISHSHHGHPAFLVFAGSIFGLPQAALFVLSPAAFFQSSPLPDLRFSTFSTASRCKLQRLPDCPCSAKCFKCSLRVGQVHRSRTPSIRVSERQRT